MTDNIINPFFENGIYKFFSVVFVVDVLSDKVLIYSVVEEPEKKEEVTLFSFMQKLSPKIHPEDLQGFFDNISLNKSNDKGDNYSFSYRYMNNDNTYSTRICVIKRKDNIIYIATLKDKFSFQDVKKEKSTKIDYSNNITDTILNIYNAVDSTLRDNSTGKYIINLLDNLVREVPEINEEFQKSMISQVNKVKNTLVIIDDDSMTRTLIRKTFNDYYDIIEFKNGDEAIKFFETKQTENVVGVFLDLFMPVVDGFAVLEYLQANSILYKVPVIIISGTEEKETRQKVYQYSIADLLEKPFNLDIIKYRTNNLIKLYKTGKSLNNMVISQQRDLIHVIETIKKAYDIDNKERNVKISKYFGFILKKVKEVYPEYKLTDNIINKCLDCVSVYDVGFYLIPRLFTSIQDEKLKKDILIDYPRVNDIIAKCLLGKKVDEETIKICSDLSLYSHEQYNGLGYPFGIREDNIPITAQCIQIAVMLELIFDEDFDKNISGFDIINKCFVNDNLMYNPKLITLLQDNIDEIKNI